MRQHGIETKSEINLPPDRHRINNRFEREKNMIESNIHSSVLDIERRSIVKTVINKVFYEKEGKMFATWDQRNG